MTRPLRLAAIALVLATVSHWPSLAAAAEAEALSPAQQQAIKRSIAGLRGEADRHIANEWSDAKKVAEVMCRPLALKQLRHDDRSIDRVFLGDDNAASLSLHGNTRLEGRGQARAGNSWKTFTFSCELDPRSGRAKAFTPRWDGTS